MSNWDWYQSTVFVDCPKRSGLVSVLLDHWPNSEYSPGRNLNGYTHGGVIRREDKILCHLCWGGQPGVNCKSTSDESPTLAAALRQFGKPHNPTRVDTCVDWYESGLFDKLCAHLIAYATGNRLAINQQGDWVRGEARTLYIGSKDSPVRLVLYEKTAERRSAGHADAPEHWVRLEVRVRPKRAHRAAVSQWEPHHALEAGWVADALMSSGYWQDLVMRAVGTVWKQSDAQRARAALLKQYGTIMAQWANEVGGWEALGPAMQESITKTRTQYAAATGRQTVDSERSDPATV